MEANIEAEYKANQASALGYSFNNAPSYTGKSMSLPIPSITGGASGAAGGSATGGRVEVNVNTANKMAVFIAFFATLGALWVYYKRR